MEIYARRRPLDSARYPAPFDQEAKYPTLGVCAINRGDGQQPLRVQYLGPGSLEPGLAIGDA